MSIYYLSARPETIVSIVNAGKIPSGLPSWAHIDYLFCAKSIADCFLGNVTILQQIFILELEFPGDDNSDDFMLLESINTEFIKKIFVYSLPGSKLLNRLFNGNCPKPCIIEPAIYPHTPKQGQKRPMATFFKENATKTLGVDTKKPRIQASSGTSNNSIIRRLGSYEEHIQLLKNAFCEAKRSILITSFSINHETLKNANLYELIPLAITRGVRIYIYYNDQQAIDPKIINFLKQNKISFTNTYTHSKILAVDRHLVAAGSFNWLSAINANYEASDEGSLCIRDEEICDSLIEEFWKYIKYYRNEQFGNFNYLDRFEDNDDNMSSLCYELEDETELSYLPTLDEHSGFLIESLESAKSHVIICSPFISAAQAYKEDIDYNLLEKTIARGVDIYFVCSNKEVFLEEFNIFLAKIHSSKIHIISMKNIHLKTIIVDENTIAEGSFNWLSATRDREADYHNHEQTLVVQGDKAKILIEHFFKSRVGKAVLNSENEKLILPENTYAVL